MIALNAADGRMTEAPLMLPADIQSRYGAGFLITPAQGALTVQAQREDECVHDTRHESGQPAGAARRPSGSCLFLGE